MAGENDKKEESPFVGFEDHSADDNLQHSADADDKKADDDPAGDADNDDVDGDGQDNSQKEMDLGENSAGDDEVEDDQTDDDDDAEDGGEDDPEDGGEDETEDDDAEDDPKPAPKKKRSVNSRIAEFRKRTGTAERRAETAERRAEQAEARLKALQEPLTGKDKGGSSENEDGTFGLTKPDPTDLEKYKYGELDAKYQDDITDYKVDLRLAQRDAKKETSQQEAAAQEQAEVLQKTYDTRVVDGIKAYDDFEEVVVEAADNGEFPLGEAVGLLALQSDVGHHVLYKIAGDLELAKKLDAMTPAQQGREFGRLEAQFSKRTPPKKNKPNAGPPASRRRGGKSGASRVKGNTTDFGAFEDQVSADEGRRNKR